jgi:carboxyl-terminal processing protease
MSSSFNIYAAELDVDKLNEEVDLLKLVIQDINKLYQYDIDQDAIIKALYDGFFSILDDYSVIYTENEYQSFDEQMSGEFGGIGVQITLEKDKIIVSSPLPNSPALKAGIKSGDEIIAVNGQSVVGFNTTEASKLIKGEIDTVVNIEIKRGDTKLTFNIKRDRIVVSSVESKILDKNIGYLKITDFNENTTGQVEEALANFDKNNITKIILDVRDNLGGFLDVSIDILNLFVPKGPLLYVNYKSSGEKVYESTLEKQKYKICVLVNEYSASASEIFAGAIQDRGVGKVIGATSYGKGVVQGLFNIPNGFKIKLTIAEYFTANKNKVQGIGIKPDIFVENNIGQAKIDLSTYPQLKKDRKPTLNTIGLDVLAAEMILKTLGYKVNEPDGILDMVSFEQIKLFQKNNNLHPYGVLDFSTQDALSSAIKIFAAPETEDLQLKKAIEIIK